MNRFDDNFAVAMGLTKKELIILNAAYEVLVTFMHEAGRPVNDPAYTDMLAQTTVASFLKKERGISA